jgi:hypothetical protein
MKGFNKKREVSHILFIHYSHMQFAYECPIIFFLGGAEGRIVYRVLVGRPKGKRPQR